MVTYEMDLLDCQNGSRCNQCHHFVNNRCELLLALEEATAPRSGVATFSPADTRYRSEADAGYQSEFYELFA